MGKTKQNKVQNRLYLREKNTHLYGHNLYGHISGYTRNSSLEGEIGKYEQERRHFISHHTLFLGAFQVTLVVKKLPANAEDIKRYGFDPWVRKIPWSRTWQPTLVFLSGEFHGQRSLEGYSPWGCKESDTTEVTSHANTLSFLPFECCPIYMDYSIKWLVIF